ncbi:acetyl-CoA/propionyl-CoA carboxylase, biotin carboxylase, biotin carboxyl carrier protein [Frankia sp. EI5c]|uniref:ATP-binding protein n=1 Tax=Frankia sp. EI5c TaxID=683316 RepID=UPI0007C33B2B|nr:biotin carboxylase N-terminal domain-containing protein [Frankia sp. EI5c]OAA18911.1 acetyl-CoA/propionyl-CoA carboxylase, biotin carboxylase, biotin carboxyl carrier protein [Frankia sp. EI5c]
MFHTVLVANRGEIAVRVIRTLRELGVRSVAVYSDADAQARHVAEADVAVRLGPARALDSYLNIERVIAAAAATGAEAIHPGYGFLAENPAFARACAAAGVVFVGPSPTVVDLMGNKIAAKRTVAAAGVPVVPGRVEPGMSDDDLVEASTEIGYPVLVKPAAGGGGKGMRLVRDPADLPEALRSARREAAASFGDDTLFVERFVDTPRHIEVQILADTHGNVIHLGERECSLQRRHQKIVEEAPSVLLDAATRARIGGAAVDVAAAVGYVGAGTVEFVVGTDRPDEFFFMEMNTRLQVEHPVTELVTGVDLVAEQLRVAAGEPLRRTQEDIRLTGHAVEARVYAEDPARGFLPTGGDVLVLREPAGQGVRVDSGLAAGSQVAATYDPMLAKVVAWAPDRAGALARLDTALAGTTLLGVTTNIGFLRRLLAHPDTRAGRLDTGLVERHLDALTATGPDAAAVGGEPTAEDALAVFGLVGESRLVPTGPIVDPWDVPSGWRLGEPAWSRWSVSGAGGPVRQVGVLRTADGATTVRVDDGPARAGDLRWLPAAAPGQPPEALVTVDGRARRWQVAVTDDAVWVGADGFAWSLAERRAERGGDAAAGDHGGEARSPMPGIVVDVRATAGDAVEPGAPLVVVEAMKMEHTVVATVAGQVKDVLVRVGDSVALDALLAVVEPAAVVEQATAAGSDTAAGSATAPEPAHRP